MPTQQGEEVNRLQSRIRELELSLKSATAAAAIADKAAQLAQESASRAWKVAFQPHPTTIMSHARDILR